MSSPNGQCQVLSCTNARFTFCPHCSSHVCIECLNEHYKLMETEYKEGLINFKKELCNDHHHHHIEEHKKKLDQFYNNELLHQCQFESFLSSKIDQNGIITETHFRPCQYLELKENFAFFNKKRIKFDQLIDKINQLLDDYEQDADISSEIETNKPFNNAITSQCDIPYENSSTPPDTALIIEIDDDDPIIEPSSVDTQNSPIDSLEEHLLDEPTTTNSTVLSNCVCINPQDLIDQNPKRIYTTSELKCFRFYCPLTKYTFGLNKNHYQTHGITNIPCPRSSTKIYTLYAHLHSYHAFNGLSALKIIRAVLHSHNKLDQIDLFSNISSSALSGNKLLSFCAHCPLKRTGIYGLLPKHQVKLCSGKRTNKIQIHHHLVHHHNIEYRYATRLVYALMDNVDPSRSIFQPEEIIVRQN